jgi:hypothetical protein
MCGSGVQYGLARMVTSYVIIRRVPPIRDSAIPMLPCTASRLFPAPVRWLVTEEAKSFRNNTCRIVDLGLGHWH